MPKLMDFLSGRMLQEIVCSALTFTQRTRYDYRFHVSLFDSPYGKSVVPCCESPAAPCLPWLPDLGSPRSRRYKQSTATILHNNSFGLFIDPSIEGRAVLAADISAFPMCKQDPVCPCQQMTNIGDRPFSECFRKKLTAEAPEGACTLFTHVC